MKQDHLLAHLMEKSSDRASLRVGLIQGLCNVTKDPVPCHVCLILSLDLSVVTGCLPGVPRAASFPIKSGGGKERTEPVFQPSRQSPAVSYRLDWPELLTVA